MWQQHEMCTCFISISILKVQSTITLLYDPTVTNSFLLSVTKEERSELKKLLTDKLDAAGSKLNIAIELVIILISAPKTDFNNVYTLCY